MQYQSYAIIIMFRFTPYEWPSNDQPEKVETQFTLLNCLWFAIGK